MSQQNLMEFLFYVFSIWVVIFALVILFIEFRYHPDDSFYIKPIAKGFVIIYFVFFLLAIIFNLNVFF